MEGNILTVHNREAGPHSRAQALHEEEVTALGHLQVLRRDLHCGCPGPPVAFRLLFCDAACVQPPAVAHISNHTAPDLATEALDGSAHTHRGIACLTAFDH